MEETKGSSTFIGPVEKLKETEDQVGENPEKEMSWKLRGENVSKRRECSAVSNAVEKSVSVGVMTGFGKWTSSAIVSGTVSQD